MMKQTPMRVDLWTDIICPWCYIGVSRFERAVARFGGAVTVKIHPFLLDPEASIPGIPAPDRYRAKFGDEAPAIMERVEREAKRDGLPFDLTHALTANTFDAHRALAFAARTHKERELEHALYRAYFVEGLDVSDRGVLADIGASLDLDRGALERYLASDEGVDEIREELESAYERGISAVPTFLFEGEFAVPGAVDEEMFLRILQQMSALHEGV